MARLEPIIFDIQVIGCDQCNRMGRAIFKRTCLNTFLKVTQILVIFSAILKITFKVKTDGATFVATFTKAV